MIEKIEIQIANFPNTHTKYKQSLQTAFRKQFWSIKKCKYKEAKANKRELFIYGFHLDQNSKLEHTFELMIDLPQLFRDRDLAQSLYAILMQALQ